MIIRRTMSRMRKEGAQLNRGKLLPKMLEIRVSANFELRSEAKLQNFYSHGHNFCSKAYNQSKRWQTILAGPTYDRTIPYYIRTRNHLFCDTYQIVLYGHVMNTFSHWLNLTVVCFSLATSTVHCETTTLQGHVPNTLSNLLHLSLFILIITGLPLESQSWHLLAGWWWDLANSFGVGKLRWLLVRVVG